MKTFIQDNLDLVVGYLKENTGVSESHVRDFKKIVGGYYDYPKGIFSEDEELKSSLDAVADTKSSYAYGIFKRSNFVDIPALDFQNSEKIKNNHKKYLIQSFIRELNFAGALDKLNKFNIDIERARTLMSYLQGNTRIAEALEMSITYQDRLRDELIKRFDIVEDPSYDLYQSKEFLRIKDHIKDNCRVNDELVGFEYDILGILKDLTDEEIESNTTKKEIKLFGKRYGAGAKLTRILSAISSKGFISNKIVNQYNLQKENGDIFITTHALAAGVAGAISDSCFSPGGCNSYANISSINYKEVFWAFNEDLTWRTIITVNEESSSVAIHAGYPEQKFYNLRLLEEFFVNKGYTVVSPDSFIYSELEYWSYTSPFSSYPMAPEKYFLEYSSFNKRISQFAPSAIEAYDVGDGYLTNYESMKESLEYCEMCDSYHRVVTEFNGSFMCEDCARAEVNRYGVEILNGTIMEAIHEVILRENPDKKTTLDQVHAATEYAADLVSINAETILEVYFTDAYSPIVGDRLVKSNVESDMAEDIYNHIFSLDLHNRDNYVQNPCFNYDMYLDSESLENVDDIVDYLYDEDYFLNSDDVDLYQIATNIIEYRYY